MNRKLSTVSAIARKKGINGKIEVSHRENKRFKITLSNGKIIHFGVWPYSAKGTFIDHHDEKIRRAWRARHSKIMKDGLVAYKNKASPEYYSWHLLW